MFDAPAERVFWLLTEPTELANWWGLHGFSTPEVQIRRPRRRRLSLHHAAAGGKPYISGEFLEALRQQLGSVWAGVLSSHFETPHTIRVGWLSPGDLSAIEEVVDLPAALSPVKVADDGTTLAQLGRGALAVTYTTATRNTVRALTAHLKSKLLSFPGGRFDTTDKAERARYGVYALDRRAAEAAALRDWATTALAGPSNGPGVAGVRRP